jgi:hypothetical protein
MATATLNVHRATGTVKNKLDLIEPVVEALGGAPEYWKSYVRYGCPICGSSDGVSVGPGDKRPVVVHCFAGECDVHGWLRFVSQPLICLKDRTNGKEW